MRRRDGATLDASQVQDLPRLGPIALAGGGLIRLVVLAVSLLSGGGGAAESRRSGRQP